MNGPAVSKNEPVLSIDGLTVAYRQGKGWLKVLRDITMEIPPGKTCGLVGESGSGKTTLALSIMQYLPEGGKVLSGTVRFAGRDLMQLSQEEMQQVWGAQMALVPQNALASMNPSLRIGTQVGEIVQRHQGLTGAGQYARVMELLEMVQLADPERVANSYPHQISGGMLQRVLIAMALSTEPLLLVLDEPTSSLDVTTEAAILELVRTLIRERGTAALYITHNLGVVAQISDRVAVLYAGELSEDAPTVDLYRQPLHPYTQGLFDCVPRLGDSRHQTRLRPIEGRIPPLDALPSGCIFRPRCPLAIEICRTYPPFYRAGENRVSRCHRWEEIRDGKISAHQPPAEMGEPESQGSVSETVLAIEDAKVSFSQRRSLVDILARRRRPGVRAVNGVSLRVQRGRTVGLVGESGSGKTTLARAIVGLTERDAGDMRLLDMPLPPGLSGRETEVRRSVQIVFQSPEEALNPYLTVGEALRRPIERLLGKTYEEADAMAKRLLDDVRLSGDYVRRLPGQLSGGEKQRIAIARAFATEPALLVADEPVSSLDVSVQASVLALLARLQAERNVSTLFISHDLAVVGYVADEIAVIYLGQLMQTGPAAATFDPPYHPYTEALLSSVPLIDPEGEQMQIRLKGEIPSPSAKVTGCPFHTRCHRFLGDICGEQVPPWREEAGTGKRSFCHIPLDELRANQQRPFKFAGRPRAEE